MEVAWLHGHIRKWERPFFGPVGNIELVFLDIDRVESEYRALEQDLSLEGVGNTTSRVASNSKSTDYPGQGCIRSIEPVNAVEAEEKQFFWVGRVERPGINGCNINGPFCNAGKRQSGAVGAAVVRELQFA